MRNLVIAIDGPSGAGKSSLGKMLARLLNYQYIDSGAVYRALACKAIDSGTDLQDSEKVSEIARESDIRLTGLPEALQIFIDGLDVTARIRYPDASQGASVVATIPKVREAVVNKLRRMRQLGGIVIDGRDIGTRVFPDAEIKLFVDASPAERARRRWLEETAAGRTASIDEIEAELSERDLRDRERSATPLVPASDAILLDTTAFPLSDVAEQALEIIRKHD